MSNNTPNNTALTAEEVLIKHLVPDCFTSKEAFDDYFLTIKEGVISAMTEHTASALAEKDREIERLSKHCEDYTSRIEEYQQHVEDVESQLQEAQKEIEELKSERSRKNNTALTAEEYKLAFQYALDNPPNLRDSDHQRSLDFIAGVRHSASALAEKDREIDKLRGDLEWYQANTVVEDLRNKLQEAQKEIEELKRSEANPYNQHIKELTDAKIELLEKSNSILTKDLQSTRDMCERLRGWYNLWKDDKATDGEFSVELNNFFLGLDKFAKTHE